MRYFVARVSTKEQNLARQLVVARERFEIPDENVFCDKASGKDFDRPEYKRMKSLLQRGDEVIVTNQRSRRSLNGSRSMG